MVPTYVLDARTATDHFPGIGRYVSSLAQAMSAQLSRYEQLLVLLQPGQQSRWAHLEQTRSQVECIAVQASPFSLRQQWLVPRILRRHRVDVYHSPYYLMPYRPGVPVILTAHDLIPQLFPRHVSLKARIVFRLTTALALRSAEHVITVSDATRRDLEAHYQSASAAITTIHEAASPQFRPLPAEPVSEMRRKYGLPESYSLYLGSNKPHKNIASLVRAWSQLLSSFPQRPPTLVIAGQWDARYPDARHLATDLGLEPYVHFLGPVAEEDLPALYSGASLFVFPSLYEGFGLPVVEAMSCGCPVACSDSSSLPEIAGDAALLFDPRSIESMVESIRIMLQDEMLRRQLAERSKRRAAHFSWQRTADETLAIYRALAESTGSS